MKSIDVTVVRVYLTEGERQLNRLLAQLRDHEHVRGFTVFRGISGLGPTGVMHVSSLTDLSLDLPLVVEFFDTPEKVETILQHLVPAMKPGHVLHWTGKVITAEEET